MEALLRAGAGPRASAAMRMAAERKSRRGCTVGRSTAVARVGRERGSEPQAIDGQAERHARAPEARRDRSAGNPQQGRYLPPCLALQIS
jgi:hypothetical protein